MGRRGALETVRAVAAWVVITAALGGLPAALVVLVGWPLPTALPSMDEVAGAAQQGIDDRTVVKGLAAMCWLAWAQFTLALGVEAEAVIRRRHAPSAALLLPGAQRLAAHLIGAALMISSLVPIRAALAHTPDTTLVTGEKAELVSQATEAPHAASSGGETLDTEPDDRHASAASRAAYRVEPRDSYWHIAERFLGEGRAWQRVRDANLGRVMSDGTTITGGSTRIEPGWVLLLPPEVDPNTPGAVPADAAGPAATGETTGTSGTGVIEVGDHLWALAGETLQTAWGREPTNEEIDPYWRSLIEANRPRLADPSNPDLVYPDQEFVLPPPPSPPPAPSEPASPATPPRDDPESSPNAGEDSEAHQDVPEPGSTPRASDPADQTPTTAFDLPAPPERSTSRDVDADAVGRASDSDRRGAGGAAQPGEPGHPAPVGALAAGGLATAGIVIALNRLRRAQQRRRRRGRTIPLPDQDRAATETQLRAGADADSARRVDLALRALTDASTPIDAVEWITAHQGEVDVVIRPRNAVPPRPFIDGGHPGSWRLDPTTSTEALETAVGGTRSPVPALLALGATADGTEILVDAERLGVVGIDGPTDQARGLVRDLALSAATAPWADDMEVVVAGEEPTLEALPWVQVVPQLSDALDYARRRAVATDHALEEAGAATPLEGRLTAIAADAFEPTLVVSLVAPTDDHAARLAELASLPERGFALITPGSAPEPAWTIELTGAGTLRLPGTALEVTPHTLDDERDAVNELLLIAARPDDAPHAFEPDPPRAEDADAASAQAAHHEERQEGDGHATGAAEARAGSEPPEHQVEDRAEGDQPDDNEGDVAALCVKVLGDVEVVATDGTPVTVERGKSLEAIAYLAVHPEGVLPELVESALWPDGTTAGSKIANVTLSAARRALGTDSTGDDHLPHVTAAGGRYRLGPAVTSDLERLRELARCADAATDTRAAATLLTDALRLVRGEPFGTRGRARYAWCYGPAATIEGEIVDAAEQLGELALENDDAATAEWAARQGLLASPYDERLFRLLMRAADAAGNPAGVEAVFTELTALLETDIEPYDALHPETAALYEQLTRRRTERLAGEESART